MLTLQMPRLLCDVASDDGRFVELTVLLGELGRDLGIWAWEHCLAPSVGLCPLHRPDHAQSGA